MGRRDLKEFIISALRRNAYRNLIWLIEGKRFRVNFSRFGSRSFIPDHEKILKDYDELKGNKYYYPATRQRLQNALRASDSFTLVKSENAYMTFDILSAERSERKRIEKKARRSGQLKSCGSEGSLCSPCSSEGSIASPETQETHENNLRTSIENEIPLIDFDDSSFIPTVDEVMKVMEMFS